MPKLNALAWIPAALALILPSSLSGCTPPPPVLSADTSCAAFRRIDTTPEQDAAAKANPGIWWSLFYAVTTHDIEFKKRCG